MTFVQQSTPVANIMEIRKINMMSSNILIFYYEILRI